MNFTQQEITLVESLIDGDLLGSFVQGKDITATAKEIIQKANLSGVSPDDFLNFLTVYYISDASSYTEDAGGKKSLDDLFVFDKENAKISLKPELETKIQDLRKLIQSMSKEAEKGPESQAPLK